MKVGDLVRNKWYPEQGQGIILGWTTLDARPMARVLWFENKTRLHEYQLGHHLEVVSESR